MNEDWGEEGGWKGPTKAPSIFPGKTGFSPGLLSLLHFVALHSTPLLNSVGGVMKVIKAVSFQTPYLLKSVT